MVLTPKQSQAAPYRREKPANLRVGSCSPLNQPPYVILEASNYWAPIIRCGRIAICDSIYRNSRLVSPLPT